MVVEKDYDLDELKRYIKDNKIYLFGCGNQGQRWIYYLEDFGLSNQILGVIDNNSQKWNTKLKGLRGEYEIISPKDFIVNRHTDSVFVTSIYYKEIVEQLTGMSVGKVINCIYADGVLCNVLNQSRYEQVIKESEKPLIPKVIHYVWLGGKMPENVKKNIEQWKNLCTDYEFKLWNEDNYDIKKNDYVYEAYKKKKWGFASDYIRLDVIYNEGGIYLDTDVEMIKSPDELLYQYGFFCVDGTLSVNTGSGFGAKEKNRVVKMLLDDYNDKHFVDSDGKLDLITCNTKTYLVLRKLGYQANDQFQKIENTNIYPMIFQGGCATASYFKSTDKTFWIHHGNMSWM